MAFADFTSSLYCSPTSVGTLVKLYPDKTNSSFDLNFPCSNDKVPSVFPPKKMAFGK
jgi:hypothetical protein